MEEDEEKYLTAKMTNNLWITSWILPVSFFYALYKKKYALSLIPLIVFFTSLNYWKDGNNMNARRMDVAAVIIGFVIQFNYAAQVDTALKYYFTISLSMILWILSNVFLSRETLVLSTTCHQLVHCSAALASIFLYIGK
jgi:hypothetical protein